MRSRYLIVLTVLLMIIGATQVFGATVSVNPRQVPKGASLVGNNYYWQSIKIVWAAAHGNGDIVIGLPDGVRIADFDADTDYDDEVAVSGNEGDGATVTYTVTGATTATSITVTQGGTAGNATATNQVWVMFPVVTDLNPTILIDDYSFTFQAPETSIAHGDAAAPEITYRALGALQIVDFEELLAGDDDVSTDHGELYPAIGDEGPLWESLPDLVFDGTISEPSNVVIAAPAPNTNDPYTRFFNALPTVPADAQDKYDTLYRIYASKDSTLTEINPALSGVIPVTNYTTVDVYTAYEPASLENPNTGSDPIAISALPEGDWYFYITAELTKKHPLARSGKLTVKHYPIVQVLGWDYDGDLAFDDTGGTDDNSVWVDTGKYFQYNGFPTSGLGTLTSLDIYIDVDDYDDPAVLSLFFAPKTVTIDATDIQLDGDNNVTGLDGAIQIGTEMLENATGYNEYTWYMDREADGSPGYIDANEYSLYVVANDLKHQALSAAYGIGATEHYVNVKHSPRLQLDDLTEYDSGGANVEIDLSVNPTIMIGWGEDNQTDGDFDLDDECVISLFIDRDDLGAVTDGLSDYAANEYSQLQTDAANPAKDTYRIAQGLLEQPEGKGDSWYEWDYIEHSGYTNPWSPTQGQQYHILAIIDESKTGGTKRVVALGVDGDVVLKTTTPIPATAIIQFVNTPYARIYDPPAKGAQVNAGDEYRINFEAFCPDVVGDIAIVLARATALSTTTSTWALIDAEASGDAYLVTETTGGDPTAADDFILEGPTVTYYDFSIKPKGSIAATVRYTDSIGGAADPITDDDYYVYIGVDDDADHTTIAGATVFYRSPGVVTLSGVGQASALMNVSMTPSKLITNIGETTTIEVWANDDGADDIDLINLYIEIPKASFDVVNPASPFSDPPTVTEAQIVGNVTHDDGNRWVIYGSVFNNEEIVLSSTGMGSKITSFQVTCKGTTNDENEIAAISFIKDGAKRWVTSYNSDGVSRNFSSGPVNVFVQPRAIIEGIVVLDGRENSDAQVTFELRKTGAYDSISDTYFEENDEDFDVEGVQYTTDPQGKFTLLNVPTGDWDLVVKYDRYLSKLKTVSINSGLDSLFVDFGTMKGGDCAGYMDENGGTYPDNKVDQSDLDMLTDAMGMTPADPEWETENDPISGGPLNYKWADINESGEVDSDDLTMATGTWLGGVDPATTGEQPFWKPAVPAPGANLYAVAEFMNIPEKLSSGETYTLQVVVHNAVDIKGYFVKFEYDRDDLTFVDVKKGDFIDADSYPLPLIEGNVVGFHNSVFGSPSFSGDGVLAEITFTANHDGVFTADMFGLRQVRLIDSTYIGKDIVSDNPVVTEDNNVPGMFALSQSFPNPFNPTTTISFSVPEASSVTLRVYDILGRHITTLVDDVYAPGNHSVVWNATDMNGKAVSAGVYFYTINAGKFNSTQRMLLMK